MRDQTEPLRTATKLAAVFKNGPHAKVADFLRLDDELRRFASSIVPDGLRGRIDSDGVAQEAWIKLRDFGPENVKYQGPGSLASYMRRIIRQVMIDHLRAEQASKRGGPGVRVALSGTDTQPELGIPSVDPTPTSGARHSEIEEIVRRTLDDMGWEVWRGRLEGHTFEEIAERLGRTAASVRGIHHRARSVIAEELGEGDTES